MDDTSSELYTNYKGRVYPIFKRKEKVTAPMDSSSDSEHLHLVDKDTIP